MAPLVAVLGASRFLGRLAIPMFVAEGWRVRALDRRQAAIAGMLGVERDWADPLDERSLTRATTDCTCVLDLGSSESGADAVATTEAAVLAGGAGRIIRVERLGAPVPAPGGDPARVTVVRCAPVIGAGAPWVVILRALGDRLPVIRARPGCGARPSPSGSRCRARARVAAGGEQRRARATTSRARIAPPTASCWRRRDRPRPAPAAGDAGIAGDVVTRVALGVAARSEPEVAALAAALPAPESVSAERRCCVSPSFRSRRSRATGRPPAGGRRRGI